MSPFTTAYLQEDLAAIDSLCQEIKGVEDNVRQDQLRKSLVAGSVVIHAVLNWIAVVNLVVVN